jgi:hypothetical protein
LDLEIWDGVTDWSQLRVGGKEHRTAYISGEDNKSFVTDF